MNLEQKEIERKVKFYNHQYFENYFKEWQEKPYLCKKWQNAKKYNQKDWQLKVCIFSDPHQSSGFRLWCISKQL